MNTRHLLLSFIVSLMTAACMPLAPASSPVPQSPVVITVVVTPTLEATTIPTETPTPVHTATPAGPTRTPRIIATPEALITYPWINMRKGPGSWYEKVAELNQGTRVAVLAQYDTCSWLYVRTGDGMIGWLIANPEYLELNTPCEALPEGMHRPATSIVRPNSRGGGSGELQINNETPEDVIIVLTWADSPIYAAYIRSRETFYMSGIADGNYALYFYHGSDWNGNRFMREVSYRRFTNLLDFASDNETYTAWTVTLHGVDGGGTPDTEEIPADTFPQW